MYGSEVRQTTDRQRTAFSNKAHFKNIGARLIFNANRCKHVTPLLCQLHWLRVTEQITFKLVTLMFQCVNGTSPGYISADVR